MAGRQQHVARVARCGAGHEQGIVTTSRTKVTVKSTLAVRIRIRSHIRILGCLKQKRKRKRK